MIVLTKEFKPSEFECQCGCGLGLENMDKVIMKQLMTARKTAKVSFTITSAIRCEERNRLIGGSPSSSHLLGKAIDIAYSDMKDLKIKVEALIEAGVRRIGVNAKKKFIHVDSDETKPEGMFIY